MPNDCGLTDRQRKFVDAYSRGGVGKEAAASAGYSQKWAASAASRLLQRPEIAAALKRRAEGRVAAPPTSPESPLAYLLGIMNDPEARTAARMKAAIAAARYVHRRPGVGKKETTQEQAKEVAAAGRFQPSAPPLTLVKPTK